MASAQDPLNRGTTPPAGATTGRTLSERDPAYDVNDPRHKESVQPGAASYGRGTDSRAIHRDIARTRGEMDETVDALTDRLKPRHLLNEVLDWVGLGENAGWSDLRGSSGHASSESEHDYTGAARDYGLRAGHAASSGGKRALSALGHQVREHPLPAALIGAGLAWLVYESTEDRHGPRHAPGQWRDLPEHSGSYVDARTGQPYSSDYGPEEHESGRSVSDRARDAASGAGHAASSTASKTAGMAGSAARSAGHAAGSAASSVGHAASSAAGSAASAASHGARATGSSLRHGAASGYGAARRYGSRGYDAAEQGVSASIEQYPLATGIAALAAGILAGLALPHTRLEDRYFGEEADELKDAARDVGRSAWQHGKEAAGSTAGAASDEARRQGIDPESLKGKAQALAETVARDVRETAEDVTHDLKEGASKLRDDVKHKAEEEGVTPDELSHKAKAVANATKDQAKHEGSEHAHAVKDEAAHKSPQSS